jgi:hypothetical protein
MNKEIIAEQHRREFESMLADALVDVATEIRLTDPCELIGLIRGERTANLADLVTSSTELFFKTGTVRYGLFAVCRVNWNEAPEFGLSMEFHHRDITAFFQLLIGRRRAGVELVDVQFGEADLADGERRARLAGAILDAKLTRH